MLDKITLDDIKPSSRRYPYVRFTPDREIGNDLLIVDGVSKTVEGKEVLSNVSFTVNPNDKVILLGDEVAKTTLLKILAGEMEPDSGTVKWGITTSRSYMPKDNSEYFEGLKLSLVEWLRQYEGIIAFKGSVFFTSHDYEFIQTIANRVVELTPEGAINKEMDYENYLRFKGIID